MHVRQDGLTFTDFRSTGNTNQFVRLVFTESKPTTAPIIHDPQEGCEPSQAQILLAEEMLSRFADKLPLHGRWYVLEVQLAEGDAVESVGYWALFRDLMAEAELALPVEGPAPEGARTWRPSAV